MKKILIQLNHHLSGWYLLILFFILWEIAPRVGLANPRFVPPLTLIYAALLKLTVPTLLVHIAVSLKRTLIGFVLATLVGLPMGFILGGWIRSVARFLKPFFNLLSQINALILFPVFVIIFGIGEIGKVSVIFWAAFWPILFTTISGVQHVDPLFIKCARSMGANGVVIFFKVILPGASLSIFNGIKTGLTMAFMMLIGAESLGADSGVGWLIHNAQANALIPRIYLGVIVVAGLGLALNSILQWLEEELILWKEPTQEKI